MEKELTGYPSIDKPWMKYYSKKSPELPTYTIYQNIWRNNKNHLDQVAIKYYGATIKYQKMFAEVARCAKALKQAGVQYGDCVTLCTAGTPEAIYTVLACSMIGAIANFINPLFEPEQMAARINDTKSNILLVLDKMYSYVSLAVDRTCIKQVVIIPAAESLPLPTHILETVQQNWKGGLKSKGLSWREFLQNGENWTMPFEEKYQPNTPVIMVYSSGTTGASKGIVLTNDGVNATIAHYQSPAFPYENGSTFLQMIPVWFSTGIVLSVLMPLCLGITVIPEPIFTKEVFAKDIAKYKPNMTLTATSLWVYAVHSKELQNANLSFMKYPITGGEQVTPQIENEINHFLAAHQCGSKLLAGWGMCELGSTITAAAPEYIKTGSVGFPMLNVSVAAFNMETEREQPYNIRGELRVLSPARMKEYYNNPQATSEFFKKDSAGNIWGCTGDVGYVDEDGFVFICGRASDIYHDKKGKAVYSFDAENVILKCTSVSACKVVESSIDGKPVPVAHLVMKCKFSGEIQKALSEIVELIKNELPEDAWPAYYKLRENLPVHANGKRDIESMKRDTVALNKF